MILSITTNLSTIVRFTWHFCICGGKRGKEKVEKWALMQEPASTTTWWSIGRGTYMEVVRNQETHAGRSTAVKMKMASQITGTHLFSSNSLSNHIALCLQQPSPSSSRVSVKPTRRNCPAAYHAGKARPRLLNSIQYTNFVSMDCARAMEQSV